MNITLYRMDLRNEALNHFQNTILDIELRYLASELPPFEYSEIAEIESAIKRALIACRTANVPIRNNFKKVYLSRNGQIHIDWRLSSLGRKLLLLNGDPSNPLIARLQLELAGRI